MLTRGAKPLPLQEETSAGYVSVENGMEAILPLLSLSVLVSNDRCINAVMGNLDDYKVSQIRTEQVIKCPLAAKTI